MVRDLRHLTDEAAMFQALVEHVELATNGEVRLGHKRPSPSPLILTLLRARPKTAREGGETRA
jgi:hypothetical protein